MRTEQQEEQRSWQLITLLSRCQLLYHSILVKRMLFRPSQRVGVVNCLFRCHTSTLHQCTCARLHGRFSGSELFQDGVPRTHQFRCCKAFATLIDSTWHVLLTYVSRVLEASQMQRFYCTSFLIQNAPAESRNRFYRASWFSLKRRWQIHIFLDKGISPSIFLQNILFPLNSC